MTPKRVVLKNTAFGGRPHFAGQEVHIRDVIGPHWSKQILHLWKRVWYPTCPAHSVVAVARMVAHDVKPFPEATHSSTAAFSRGEKQIGVANNVSLRLVGRYLKAPPLGSSHGCPGQVDLPNRLQLRHNARCGVIVVHRLTSATVQQPRVSSLLVCSAGQTVE